MFQNFIRSQIFQQHVELSLTYTCTACRFSRILAAWVDGAKIEWQTVGLHDSIELAVCQKSGVSAEG